VPERPHPPEVRLEDRLLLFLDILGFSALVRSRGEQEVFRSVDACLRQARSWVDGVAFASIYFSDTIVIYSTFAGYNSTFRDDFIAIASGMFTALAAQGIPTRIALAFGTFAVRRDSAGESDVFFGEGLVEAALTEKRTKIVGIVLCKSFAAPYEKRHLKYLVAQGELVQSRGGPYYVHPFPTLRRWPNLECVDSFAREFPRRFRDSSAETYLLEQEVRALDFLRVHAAAGLSKPLAAKYRNALRVAEKPLSAEASQWVSEAAEGLRTR
jgi:hypothetical protein